MQAGINSVMVEDPNIPLVTGGAGSSGHKRTMYTLSRQLRPSISESQSKLVSPPSIDSLADKHALSNVGYRLAKRRELFWQRRVVCDVELGLALLGIALMVIETVCTLQGYYTKSSIYSYCTKGAITASTIVLLMFDIWYQVLETQIIMVDNTLDDWRLTISTRRIALITLELLIYSVHPIPGSYFVTVSTYETYSSTTKLVVIPIDIFLSIPMVLRVHLIARSVMLHSQLYMNASSQSLGALNRIHFNIKFVFKSLMDLHPGLFVFTASFSVFVVASWLMWACEVTHQNVHASVLNSCWIVAITFLTIGYGDLVPISYCGRTISVLTGLLGAGCTALIVALLTRTLQLSRSERYVHDFVIDIALEKQRKIVAANMVKYCWRAYKYRKTGKMAAAQRQQRHLFVAVQAMRDIRLGRRSLVDKSVTLAELNKSQGSTHDSIVRMENVQRDLDTRVASVETRLSSLDAKMDTLRDLLSARR